MSTKTHSARSLFSTSRTVYHHTDIPHFPWYPLGNIGMVVDCLYACASAVYLSACLLSVLTDWLTDLTSVVRLVSPNHLPPQHILKFFSTNDAKRYNVFETIRYISRCIVWIHFFTWHHSYVGLRVRYIINHLAIQSKSMQLYSSMWVFLRVHSSVLPLGEK